MGIKGLKTFINNESHYYLTDYELQNTHLVIDGWSLCFDLYLKLKKPNCIFGGDYDLFYDCVIQFFGDLSKCKIKPIVLIDGGWEIEKRETICSRSKERLETASNYGLKSPKFFPILLCDVFKSALVKLGIKFVMCPFEADNRIAAVANALECPVLSNDSDFYIFGVMYISSESLEERLIYNENGYAMKSKIYRIEKLLTRFEGLDTQKLPLISILLGNDYISRNFFDRFFNELELTRSQSRQQAKILAAFNWLKDCTLNFAISILLVSIPETKQIIKLMEIIINGYLILNTDMLKALGYSEEFILERTQKDSKPFKFQNYFDLENEKNIKDENESDDDDNKMERIFLTREEFKKSLPDWFINEHEAGDLGNYFSNMISERIYIELTQIEDFTFPSATEISIPILKAIFSLLIPMKETKAILRLIIREKDYFVRREIEVERASIGFENLRIIEMSERKKFIDNVLGIREEHHLDEIPEAWRLYVAVIIFWMRQKNLPEKTNTHLYCILVGMLFGIINEKIGFQMTAKKLKKKYGFGLERLVEIRKYDKESNIKNKIDRDLIGSLKLISTQDCIMAAPFFFAHCGAGNFSSIGCLLPYSRKVNFGIIHAFAQFQVCLRHIMYLNALLGFPYPQINPGELYKGTLLYNLYTSFIECSDVIAFIKQELELSPQFFELFRLLNKKVMDIRRINETE